MSIKTPRILVLLFVVTAVVWSSAFWSTACAAEPMTTGKAGLKSIGALALGPDNVLFAADSAGAAVYALEMTPPASAGTGSFVTVQDLDAKIAALLGTSPRDIFVKDMAVNRATSTVYLSVMRGAGEDALPAIVTVNRSGDVGEVDLGNVRHARLSLDDAPDAEAKLYSWESRSLTITDLEFIDGELFVAGLSNEEWASALRRAPWPFTDEVAATSLEIYHGAHGTWETFAPIFSFIPYEIGGETHLLAGYLCTPLVTFPLDEVRSKPRLRGKTIAELGWGNIPTDIVAYEKDGEGWVLINNSSRGTMRIKASDIVAAQKKDGITSEVGPRSGLEDHTVPIGRASQVADYSPTHVLILGRDMENGSLYLRPTGKHRL